MVLVEPGQWRVMSNRSNDYFDGYDQGCTCASYVTPRVVFFEMTKNRGGDKNINIVTVGKDPARQGE